MDDDSWSLKQARLRDFLADHGAEEAPYRIDLSERKIFWVDSMGLSLVVADCRVLLSYALSNRSVMMAWANASLAAGSGIEELEDFNPYYADCDTEDVWALATGAAEEVGAEALFRAPSPQSWVLLGLWNLRTGGAEQFYSGSPRTHVLTVLTQLAEHPAGPELSVLIDNYAESFLQMAGHPHKGTRYEEALKDTARSMRNLLAVSQGEADEERRARLEALLADWRGEDGEN